MYMYVVFQNIEFCLLLSFYVFPVLWQISFSRLPFINLLT